MVVEREGKENKERGSEGAKERAGERGGELIHCSLVEPTSTAGLLHCDC